MANRQVKWRQWKRFSGPSIKGTVLMGLPDSYASHWERVLYVTALVESGGLFGAVTMYDGTCVTADLIQKVMVYPRSLGQQGTLGKSLHRIYLGRTINASDQKHLRLLLDAFDREGWILADDGLIRDNRTGEMIAPRELRDTITPTGGAVPRRGPAWQTSRQWAMLFHNLFAASWTHRIQVEYGIEHFVKMADRARRPQIGGKTVGEVAYNGLPHDPNPYMDEVADLAMAVFWSNSVNGPSPSLKCLARALKKEPAGSPEFGKWLIRFLGNSSYGRFDDDIPGGRYQRTRRAAMKVYPRWLFVGDRAVMPRDLPG